MKDPKRFPRRPGALLVLAAAACAPGDVPGAAAATTTCQVVESSIRLPEDVAESSGLAESRVRPGVFWTHNDSGGDPVLYAVNAAGQLLGTVRVTGAENKDWEDVAVGPCPGGSCLYIGDTGDNNGKRKDVEVYRVPEPLPTATATAPAQRFKLRYPQQSRDSEAMFVLPDGTLYLITKGRQHPVELFRAAAPLRAGATSVLQRVSGLSTSEPGRIDQVTGAAATPDGRRVAVRTYTGLYVFRTADLLSGDQPAAERVDLAPLDEPQGEAVEIRDDGTVFLTSESPGKGDPALMAQLSCSVE
ncbi:MAG TPA: hypothetical protein VGV85_05345 [Longimicrobiaceae bacterium]|nr:hypothetical protein [Longimicrobiaceae bacterium]